MQISWDHSAAQRVRSNPHKRLISLGLVGAIHVAAIYALLNGMVPGASRIVPGIATLIPDPVQPVPKKSPPSTDIEKTFVGPTVPKITPPDVRIQNNSDSVITVVHGTVDTYIEPPPPVAPTQAQGIAGTHTIPPYPDMAIRLAQQGTVTLRLSIGPDGMVDDAQVEKSSGSALLDDAAVAWVKGHWRYKAATKDGSAVASTMLAAVRFDLKNAR
ncbi:MAG TPA: energy transducer TonB [Rhizomicrobium sp.]|jgi:protein TonB